MMAGCIFVQNVGGNISVSRKVSVGSIQFYRATAYQNISTIEKCQQRLKMSLNYIICFWISCVDLN